MERSMRDAALPSIGALVAVLSIACVANDVRPLLERATLAYRAERFGECGELFERALEVGAAGPEPAYNGACCRAREGDTERAFRLLHEAARRGYRNADWIERDEDLAGLRADPQWIEVLAAVRGARENYLARVNRELVLLYEADQADRETADASEIDWSVVGPRDDARRARVYELIEEDALRAADDYFHAAMVLQHGNEPDDYARAHELAVRAVELDPTLPRARWLAAAAEDRHLQSLGRPQIYGTQLRKDPDGPWTLDPIDETAVTDEERARWGVPPLAEAKDRVKAMNGG